MSPAEEFSAKLIANPPSTDEVKEWLEAIEQYEEYRKHSNREIVLREKLPVLGKLYDRVGAPIFDHIGMDVFDGLRLYVCYCVLKALKSNFGYEKAIK